VCERGALRQVVPTEHVQDAVAQNEARSFAAGIVGPPVGGALFAIARALPFVFDAVSFLGSMTMISLTRARFQTTPSADPGPPRKIRSDVADGFAWLWQHPFFRTTSVLFALGNPVFTGLYLLAILLAKQHGASAATVGLMLAIVGFGGLVGSLCAGMIRRAMTARTMILVEQLLLVGAVLALLLVHDALAIGVLVAGAELLTPTVNSVVAGARVAAAPDHLQGRVQAAATMATMSLAWLGPLAVGVCFEHWGSTTTNLTLADWMLIPMTIATLARALHEDPLGSMPAVSG
jgi:predicted MFS family arabinose efflux permease